MSAAQGVEVVRLAPPDVPSALAVVARAMRDNPIHIAVFRGDAERRERLVGRMFRTLWRLWDQSEALCAKRDGEVVGVCGRLPPGSCQLSVPQTLRMVPVMSAGGPGVIARSLRWVSAWGKRDPGEPHEHLGPVAVDRHLQGLGIGTAMLAVHAEDLDLRRRTGWLETDKPENVRLYERFGYVVEEEVAVLGVPNWFMRRPQRR